MAKRKGSSKRPQAEHKRNLKKSQHDKRKRLQRLNPNRKKTKKAKVPLAGAMQTAVLVLQAVLDQRMAFRRFVTGGDPCRRNVAGRRSPYGQ